MLRRFKDLASERKKEDLAEIFNKELRRQVFEWMGVGAAARQIYKKTVRPEVLAQARERVATLSKYCKVFDGPISRAEALGAGRKIRRELIELSSLLVPEGEAQSNVVPRQDEE